MKRDIKIDVEVADSIKKIKLTERESYQEIILRLLEHYKKTKGDK